MMSGAIYYSKNKEHIFGVMYFSGSDQLIGTSNDDGDKLFEMNS